MNRRNLSFLVLLLTFMASSISVAVSTETLQPDPVDDPTCREVIIGALKDRLSLPELETIFGIYHRAWEDLEGLVLIETQEERVLISEIKQQEVQLGDILSLRDIEAIIYHGLYRLGLKQAFDVVRANPTEYLDVDNITQAALLGIFETIQLYDPKTHIRKSGPQEGQPFMFSTIAYRYVDHKIKKALRQGQSGSFETTAARFLRNRRINFVINQLVQENFGGRPTVDEIVDRLNKEFSDHYRTDHVHEAILRNHIVTESRSYFSVERWADGDSSDSYSTEVPALEFGLSGEGDPIDNAAQIQLREKMIAFVDSQLTEREAKIIKLRFGLDDPRHVGFSGDTFALTQEQVGVYFEVQKERIRQIEAKALRKLRYPGRWLEFFGEESSNIPRLFLGDESP